MNDFTKNDEAILIECLRALDAGTSLDECLARYPGRAAVLRPYLELESSLRSSQAPVPSPQAFEHGRQALLDSVAGAARAGQRETLVAAAGTRWRLVQQRLTASMAGGWSGLRPLARAAAVVVAAGLIAGGALGASAAAGVQPAHDVLSALRIVQSEPESDQTPSPNSDEGAGNADDGIGNASPAADNGRDHADESAFAGSGNANHTPESDDAADATGTPSNEIGDAHREHRCLTTDEIRQILEVFPDFPTALLRRLACDRPDETPGPTRTREHPSGTPTWHRTEEPHRTPTWRRPTEHPRGTPTWRPTERPEATHRPDGPDTEHSRPTPTPHGDWLKATNR